MDLIIKTQGRTGRITLNRPDALNALTHDMVLVMEDTLNRWADDETIDQVIVDAAGDKAFCAGGDIQHLYKHGRAGDDKSARDFWRDEYRLNALIANFPKPYIAMMQGFVMGGGVGVACHAAHRITDDTTRIALPECSIGLIPDVGSSLLLARAPGGCGEYIAATGYRMNASDAIYAGFADYYVPRDQWQDLISALIEDSHPDAITAYTSAEPPLKALQAVINKHFEHDTMVDICANLNKNSDEFSIKTAAILARQSPLSIIASLAVIRAVRKAPSIAYALEMEYRFTSRSIMEGDFLEGIRAAIIDKTRDPKWRHASIDDVTAADIAAILAPID
ncbi:MAG: 3-hydroxyisobutyryl-CoA hydrolase [Candidatus Puniceispirillales bacterium WSBS_2018_MAG_OTU23]